MADGTTQLATSAMTVVGALEQAGQPATAVTATGGSDDDGGRPSDDKEPQPAPPKSLMAAAATAVEGQVDATETHRSNSIIQRTHPWDDSTSAFSEELQRDSSIIQRTPPPDSTSAFSEELKGKKRSLEEAMANDEPSDAPPASPLPPRGHEFLEGFRQGFLQGVQASQQQMARRHWALCLPGSGGGAVVTLPMAATQGLNSTMVMTAQQQQAVTAMQQLQHHCHMSFHTSPHTLRGEAPLAALPADTPTEMTAAARRPYRCVPTLVIYLYHTAASILLQPQPH